MFRRILVYSIFYSLVVFLYSCSKDVEDSNALDPGNYTVPVITTDSVTNISNNSATSGGKIVSNGGAEITAKGVCWSTSMNPTTLNSNTVDGTGSTNFISNLTGLALGTTYYVRAYATNSVGTAYATQFSFTTIATLNIGAHYAGGIVFYLDTTGAHGLVCSETDQIALASWGCPNTQIPGADGSAIGTGAQNTIDIVSNCTASSGYAAVLCDSLELNGYDDWFLPSKEELRAIYNNLKLPGIGNLSNNAYWTSSEMTSVFAWQVIFANGITQGVGKNNSASVRAVREF